MKKGLVIADAGPIFSLAILNKLDLLNNIFNSIQIPEAVWKEITFDETTSFHKIIVDFFQNKVTKITGNNHLLILYH